MNYEEFICAMEECTQKKLSLSETVERKEMHKNNGVIEQGLMIRRMGEAVAPIVYMEGFYEKYLLGVTVDSLSDFLIQKSREMPEISANCCKDIMDFSKIRHQIIYKLVNAEKNEALLKEVPHLPMLDFAILFYWVVEVNGEESGMVLIRNAHMDYWKLPISVLYQCASENTCRLCPPVFGSLSDYVEAIPEGDPLYLLSNDTGTNGASVLLYHGILKKIEQELGCSYYLLPSSVHEFLVVPEGDGIYPENLRKTVYEVNRTEIRPEEFLSDSIYYFDGDNITRM